MLRMSIASKNPPQLSGLASMAAARMLLQSNKSLPQSLRRQILFPSGVNSLSLGTILEDEQMVQAPSQVPCAQRPVPCSSGWRNQFIEVRNRQSPAFDLSSRYRSKKLPESDPQDDFEDEDFGESSDDDDPDDEDRDWDDGFNGEADFNDDEDDDYEDDRKKKKNW